MLQSRNRESIRNRWCRVWNRKERVVVHKSREEGMGEL